MNITARLRILANLSFESHDPLNEDYSDTIEDTLEWQAADEIERLEKEVKELKRQGDWRVSLEKALEEQRNDH